MNSRSRYLVMVAVIAVLAIAVIVGLQLNEPQRSGVVPSSSRRPSASATNAPSASGTPANTGSARPTGASTAPAAVLNDRFGLVLTAIGPAFDIVTETGAKVASGISGQVAVGSPTGDRIAYLQYAQGSVTLRLRTLTDNSDRVIVTLTGENATAVAWSNDGTGLLLAVGVGADTGPPPTTPATLRTVDVVSGTMQTIAQRTDGKIYKPLAWDRPGRFAAAADTGAGGFDSAYLTLDLSQTPVRTTSNAATGRISIQASADAKFASSADLDSGAVRWWPLNSYAGGGAIGTVRQAWPVWRAGTSQVGWVENGELRLFDAVLGTTTAAVRGLGSNVRLAAFRADGTAAVLATQVTPTVGGTKYSIVDLVSGATADLDIGAGSVGFSVRIR